MQPAGPDNEKFARALILANDDRTASVSAVLLLQMGERKALGLGQPHIMAEPFSETAFQNLLTPNTLISG
jgi:hypothetical protein